MALIHKENLHKDYLQDPAPTEQELARRYVHKKYGPSAYTVHHLLYKVVGFKRGMANVSAVGHTWAEAVSRLERKA